MWNKLMLTYLIETIKLSAYYPGNSLWLNREELRTILTLVEEMYLSAVKIQDQSRAFLARREVEAKRLHAAEEDDDDADSEFESFEEGLGGRIVSRNKTTKKHKNKKKHKKTKHTTLKKKYTNTQHSTRRNTKNKIKTQSKKNK